MQALELPAWKRTSIVMCESCVSVSVRARAARALAEPRHTRPGARRGRAGADARHTSAARVCTEVSKNTRYKSERVVTVQ